MSTTRLKANNVLKNYGFTILLITAILIGASIGAIFKEKAAVLKPFGDIFLNLLFTAVVPLVFFSISSAVAGMPDIKRLKRILVWMAVLFIATGVISAALMLAGVKMYPPAVSGVDLSQPEAEPRADSGGIGSKIVETLTVSDFPNLLSRRSMLALIVFSLLIGLAASAAKEKGRAFSDFLVSGNAVMMKVIDYIMRYAPIGLAAYFAYLVGVFGPQLLGSYVRIAILYYPFSLLYFTLGFSFYAFLAAGRKGVRAFWSKIGPASLTAFGTGSSLATIPANLEAADEIGVPQDISRMVIPIGATIHMDGTCVSAIVKIALLFSFFGMDFSGTETLLTALGIALLSGTVMPGIPGGGFVGELLIVTLYGFPPEALPIISMVGTIVDPPATMVNAIGSNAVSMVMARILGGKDWMNRSGPSGAPQA